MKCRFVQSFIYLFYRLSRTRWLTGEDKPRVPAEAFPVIVIKLKMWVKREEERDGKSPMTMCRAQPARYKGSIMDGRAPPAGQSRNDRSAGVAQQQFQCGSDSLFGPPTGRRRSVQKRGGLFGGIDVTILLLMFFVKPLKTLQWNLRLICNILTRILVTSGLKTEYKMRKRRPSKWKYK